MFNVVNSNEANVGRNAVIGSFRKSFFVKLSDQILSLMAKELTLRNVQEKKVQYLMETANLPLFCLSYNGHRVCLDGIPMSRVDWEKNHRGKKENICNHCNFIGILQEFPHKRKRFSI